MKLTRAVPIARQLKEILRERIIDGQYSPHARIPSESALAAEFGVSRSSIRGALSQLAGERLLIRRAGNGTYINQSMLQFSLNVGNLWEFSRHIEFYWPEGLDQAALSSSDPRRGNGGGHPSPCTGR